MIVSLEDTSSITLPRGDRLVAQPDLHLFSATGFPYVGSEGFDIALAARDKATVAASWTVLARLAQLAGRTLPEARVAVGSPADDRHVILVGAWPDLPQAVLASVPLGPMSTPSFPYASATRRPAPTPSWTQGLQALLGISAQADDSLPRSDATRIHGQSDLGRNGLLTASRGPGGNYTVTMLTAATRDSLEAATQDMVSPAVWYQLGKDVTLWRPGSDAVYTERVGPTYHLGGRTTIYAARYYIGEYPAAWIALIGSLVLLLAATLRLLLVRRRRRVHSESIEGIP